VGARTKGAARVPAQEGPSEEITGCGKRSTGDSGRLVNPGRKGTTPEPPERAPDPPPCTERGCFVRGEPVAEFYAVIAGASGSVITRTGGTAAFTMVRYDAERGFDLGDGWGRAVAGELFDRADYDPAVGLEVRGRNYAFFIPTSDLRTTWRLPLPPNPSRPTP
jgi:hypothetical protein